MRGDKDSIQGCLLIIGLFVAVTIGIPLAINLVGTENIVLKAAGLVFLGVSLLITIITIPDFLKVWLGAFVIFCLLIWLSGGLTGECVAKVPGYCE